MRRGFSAVLGSIVLASSVTLAPLTAAHADPLQPTEFQQVFLSELRPVIAGQRVQFEATLLSADEPVPGAEVSLLVRPYGAPDYTVAARTSTDTQGRATVRLRLNRTTVYRWQFAGSGSGSEGFSATTSAPALQKMASRVRIAGNDLTLKRGQRLVITGTTFPAQPGKRVLLMRGTIAFGLQQTPQPRVVGRGSVRPDGTLRLVARFAQSGAKKLFVTVAGGQGNAKGTSNYLRVRVR